MVVVSGAPAAFSVRIGEVRANLAAARELLRVVREEPGLTRMRSRWRRRC